MGKLIVYEWGKIRKNATLWIIFSLFFLGNILFIYLTERNSGEFYYVFQNRSAYEAYQKDGTDADGYYTRSDESLDEYLSGYPDFLGSMQEKAEQRKSVSVYSDEKSFVYRNLEKTCRDFSRLSDITVEKDNCFGVERYAAYNFGIFFSLVFLAVLAYLLFYRERNLGILLLLKGTKRGHVPLITAKLLMFLLAAVIYTALQEAVTLIMYGFFYGYGTLSRSIQSVSAFRNCSLPLNVGSVLCLTVLIRLCVILFAAFLFFLCSVFFRHNLFSLAVSFAFLALEYGFYRLLSVSGSLNGCKCVNLFFCWDAKAAFATYQNLNLFGLAVSKGTLAAVIALILAAIFTVCGVLSFHLSYQIKKEGIIEKIGLILRKKTAFFWHHTRLFAFEFSKIFFGQRKGIVLLILALACVFGIVYDRQAEIYSTSEEAYYHAYLHEISGPVTEKSLQFVEQKQEYIDELATEISSMEDTESGANAMIFRQLMWDYDAQAAAVNKLTAQLDGLRANGDIKEKYWIDETAYDTLWHSYGYEIFFGALGLIVVILWTSGVYPTDEKKGLILLFSSMKHGRKKFRRQKNFCVAVGTALAFVFCQLPIFCRYFRIDGLTTARQNLSDLAAFDLKDTFTVGSLLGTAFLLKAIVFAFVSFITLWLSRRFKNETMVEIIGVGVVVIPAILLYIFRTDITVWLLQTQTF